jgi:hypothetical protein
VRSHTADISGGLIVWQRLIVTLARGRHGDLGPLAPRGLGVVTTPDVLGPSSMQ